MHWRVRAVAGAWAVLPLLVACGGPESRSAASSTTQEQPSTSTAPTSSTSATGLPSSSSTRKQPADSQESAAPCDVSPTGDVVTFTIEPDVPQPRCAHANEQQHLKVINDTSQRAFVRLGSHELALGPSEQGTVEAPFGTYLEPGVHSVLVSFKPGAYERGSGPELWLGAN